MAGRDSFYRKRGKRLLDLAIAVPTLVVAAPLLMLLWAMIKLTMGSPAIFRQRRPGRHGVPFTLYKFRTMTDERDRDGRLLPDEARLTRLGRWLRRTSLDELPELWNVVRGDMSLVGPRPLLMQYLDRYTPEQARRHDVLPGLTGWAQIHGRNQLAWDERFRRDVWYVDHRGLALDLYILAATLCYVPTCRGISADGHATVPEFRGAVNKPSLADKELCRAA